MGENIRMSEIYQRINAKSYRNVWGIGDLHGCYSLLMNKLDSIGFEPDKDLLISVGDLIDRGRESVECMELLQMPWFKAVRGNHEQMMLDSLSEHGDVTHWMYNGGEWFFRLEYDKEILAKVLIELVRKLPLIIEVVDREKKTVIAHADYPYNAYEFGKDLAPELVIWNRERISSAIDGIGGPISGADIFIFGHTPVHHPVKFWNLNYIDTGAVFNGNLTLIKIKGGDNGES